MKLKLTNILLKENQGTDKVLKLLLHLQKVVNRSVQEFQSSPDLEFLESDIRNIEKIIKMIDENIAGVANSQQVSSPQNIEENFVNGVKLAMKKVQPVLGKFFISDLFEANPQGMNLEQYKQKLLEAHRARNLILSRADLTQLLDKNKLMKSMIRTQEGSVYNFVQPM